MKHKIAILFLSGLCLAACSEVDLLHPFGEDDGKAPGKVTNVQVRNFSGGATINYTLPSDADLSYIKATFKGTDGSSREMRASSYVDSMTVEGFGDTREYQIELRAYDKFENESEPVKVSVQPLEPPISLVFKSLSWQVDFGGFAVGFKNVAKSDVGIFISRRDPDTQEMEYYDAYFTESEGGEFSVRGLPNEENDFALYVQDNWGNTSEMLTFTATPLLEEFLDKKLFRLQNPDNIPGDLPSGQWDHTPSNLWDTVVDNWNYGHSKWPVELPHRFTFDLGVTAKLSRIKTWQRSGSDVCWQHGAWRLFKVYGCTELPANPSVSDPMAGWTLVGSFVSVKPSGLPLGQVNDEDMTLLAEGEEFKFDREAPAVRYLRFEINAVHSQMKLTCMTEISLWGQVEKENQ